MMNHVAATPFLKWAGGKRRLLKQYTPFFPPIDSINRYYEPFVGSGAVFFHLQPTRSFLSDQNEKLIEVYQQIQTNVEALIEALSPHKNESGYYYDIRAQNPDELTAVTRAARFIYLNKTCYNGLYRENSRGIFNVPFGRYKNPAICDADRLHTASAALQGVTIEANDFETAVSTAATNDFIYFDPPYVPLSQTSNFTSYSKHGFNEIDQRRLAATIDQLTIKGCRVMLSNSSAPLVYELYGGDNGLSSRSSGSHYYLHDISARRNINSNPNRRGPVKELLILNYN